MEAELENANGSQSPLDSWMAITRLKIPIIYLIIFGGASKQRIAWWLFKTHSVQDNVIEMIEIPS